MTWSALLDLSASGLPATHAEARLSPVNVVDGILAQIIRRTLARRRCGRSDFPKPFHCVAPQRGFELDPIGRIREHPVVDDDGLPAAIGCTQSTLYRTDRLEAVNRGWIFFSEAPGAIDSRGFEGTSPAFTS